MGYMMSETSTQLRGRWRWQSAGLSLLGAWAGAGLAANWCYWRGRALDSQFPYRLQAYAPENAPVYWFQLVVGLVWLLLWARFVYRGINVQPWFAAALPLVFFGFFLWQQLGAAHACSY